MKVIHICFSCSMLCTDGVLLHLAGKRQLLVYSGGAGCGTEGASSNAGFLTMLGGALFMDAQELTQNLWTLSNF